MYAQHLIVIYTLYLYIVFTAVVGVAMFRRMVAAHTAVLMVPSLPKPAVDNLCDVTPKIEPQIFHGIRVSVRVHGPMGVVGTLTGSFTGYPRQLRTPILQERERERKNTK